jgi:anti-anti-sigma regulatory factor
MSHVTAQSQATARAASSKPRCSPKLREITLDDYAQIASLTAPYRFTPSVWTFEQWRHFWVNNPAYLRMGKAFPRGWVLEADKRIVGHIANVPLFYQFEGQQLLVGNGCSYVVDAEYRGYALFLLDQYMNQKCVDVVLGHQANLDSARAHGELGAQAVPLGAWDRKAVWILRYQEFLADWLARKKLPAASLLSYPAVLALSTKDTWERLLLRRRTCREADIEMCAAFDERFDDFWQELCAEYPQKFLAWRTRASLEWRFHFALREKRLRIATISRGGRLRAYAIFLLQKNVDPQDRIRRVIVADFQSLERDDGIFFAILRAALKRSRKSGIHLLVTVGISASGADMSLTAPYRDRLPRHSTSLYKARDPMLSRALESPLAWCPSLYDGDMSL